MSITGPNVYVTIGDSDWFSTTNQSLDCAISSRMRFGRRERNTLNWRGVVGNGSRTSGGEKYYAELLLISGTNHGFGLTLSGNESDMISSFVGNDADSCGYFASGVINQGGAAAQSGLATTAVGGHIGLAYYKDGSDYKVQFYSNGATVGTPVTLTGAAHRLVWSSLVTATEVVLLVDREDLRYLPSDCQPWGASARVADAGGYSPVAAVLSSTLKGASITVDAYGRQASQGVADHMVIADTTTRRSTDTRFVYVEFVIDDASTGLNSMFGLARSTCTTSAYLGSTADGWGYHPNSATFAVYNNATPVSHGISRTQAVGSRPGMIWQPSTGRIWGVWDGTVIGNPEAGTGYSHDNVTGDIRPAIAPRADARIRLCTHAREQLYRPAYCEAWDGSDLLPELHYAGLLGNDPYIEQGVWYPIPWGGDRSGSPIGAIEVLNNDGDYDALLGYMLRNQRVAVDRVWEGESTPEAEARGIVSSLALEGESTLRVVTDSLLSKLDIRVDSDRFALGNPYIVPMVGINAATLTYDTIQSPFWLSGSAIGVHDNALAVTTVRWLITSEDSGAQIVRTAAPAGRQSIREMTVYAPKTTQTVSVTNGDFSSWSAGNPTSWTVAENGGTSNISQSGNACRFQRQAGAPECSISQSVTSDAGWVKIVVSSWTSGRLYTVINGNSHVAAMTAAGTYYLPSDFPTDTLKLFAEEGTDLTVDTVSIVDTMNTSSAQNAVTHLLENLGGLTSSDYVSSNLVGLATDFGMWWDNRPTVREVLFDYIFAINAPSAMPYVDHVGLIRFAEWPTTGPEAYSSSDTEWLGEVRQEDLRSSLSVEDDRAPTLTDTFTEQRNYAVHNDNEIAGAVTDADQAVFVSEFSGFTSTSSLHDFYAHAVGAPRIHSREGSVLGPYDTRRYFYRFKLPASVVRRWKPGGIFELTHARFGLSSGKNLMLVRLSRNAQSPVVDVMAWG